MTRLLVSAIAVLAATLGLVFSAGAEVSSEDAFKYRQSVMTALRGHIGAASMIVRGIVADDGHLEGHAAGLQSGVAEIHRVFQEGSNVEESEALPVIWENSDEFAEAIEKAEAATEHFYTVVAEGGDGEAIGAAFRDVGMSCRGCHDNFRVAD